MKMEVGLVSHPPPLIHPTLPSPHCPISLGTLGLSPRDLAHALTLRLCPSVPWDPSPAMATAPRCPYTTPPALSCP